MPGSMRCAVFVGGCVSAGIPTAAFWGVAFSSTSATGATAAGSAGSTSCSCGCANATSGGRRSPRPASDQTSTPASVRRRATATAAAVHAASDERPATGPAGCECGPTKPFPPATTIASRRARAVSRDSRWSSPVAGLAACSVAARSSRPASNPRSRCWIRCRSSPCSPCSTAGSRANWARSPWQAATSARCNSDSMQIRSKASNWSDDSVLSRYSATELGSSVRPRPSGLGAPIAVRPTAARMRSTRWVATTLDETFLPSSCCSSSGSTPSSHASSVLRVRRMVLLQGAVADRRKSLCHREPSAERRSSSSNSGAR